MEEKCFYCKASPLYLAFPNVRDRLRVDDRARSFYSCPKCGSLRLVPTPAADALMQAYPTNYCFSVSHSRGNIAYLLSCLQERFLYKPVYKAQVRLVLKNVPFENWGSHPSLLDVGRGKADRLCVFAKRGFDVYALDLVPENVRQIKESLNIPAICGNAEAIGEYFAPKSFNIITAFALLEHLRQPDSFVKQCFELLKPGGALVLLVPIADSIWVQLFRHRWAAITEVPRHVSLPSTSGLVELLHEAGYEDIVIRPDTVRNCAGVVGTSVFPKGLSYFYWNGFLIYRLLAVIVSLSVIPIVIAENWARRRGANVIAIARRPGYE
jgi:SAM-dependent methyltransferase